MKEQPAKVLFACRQNAGRSQIGAAIFNRLADPSKATAVSAGPQPAAQIHPDVVQLTQKHGIDLSGKSPQMLTPELAGSACVVVNLGCDPNAIPDIPGLEKLEWLLQDAKGKSQEELEEIYREAEALVQQLVASKGWSKPE